MTLRDVVDVRDDRDHVDPVASREGCRSGDRGSAGDPMPGEELSVGRERCEFSTLAARKENPAHRRMTRKLRSPAVLVCKSVP
jgi:hypothetical protein